MDNFHIYTGCYNDLIMGTAVSVAYVKVGNGVSISGKYLEVSTINYAYLVALNLGLESVKDDRDYIIHINSRYINQVLNHCQSWRAQGLLDEKAHPEQIKILLGHIDRLGNGQINYCPYQRHWDELMTRTFKHCKHFYQQVQLEIISKRTTSLDPYLFGPPKIMAIQDLPGSVLWKRPFSISEFEKRMGKARTKEKPALKLIYNSELEA